MSFSTLLRPGITADLALQPAIGPTEGGRAEKIRKYAGEFEATLLANLYKDMEHSLGGSPTDEDPGADTLSDMGIHALATGLVSGGGIGIAKLLIQYLSQKGDTNSTNGNP